MTWHTTDIPMLYSFDNRLQWADTKTNLVLIQKSMSRTSNFQQGHIVVLVLLKSLSGWNMDWMVSWGPGPWRIGIPPFRWGWQGSGCQHSSYHFIIIVYPWGNTTRSRTPENHQGPFSFLIAGLNALISVELPCEFALYLRAKTKPHSQSGSCCFRCGSNSEGEWNVALFHLCTLYTPHSFKSKSTFRGNTCMIRYCLYQYIMFLTFFLGTEDKHSSTLQEQKSPKLNVTDR